MATARITTDDVVAATAPAAASRSWPIGDDLDGLGFGGADALAVAGALADFELEHGMLEDPARARTALVRVFTSGLRLGLQLGREGR